MKTVIFAPYAAKLRNGKMNPKNYPFWEELIGLLKEKGFHIVQIGVKSEEKINGTDSFLRELSFSELEELICKDETLVFSVDSFLPHFCRTLGRACIVLWGKSDPNIFGYPENINLLKNRSNLRSKHDQWVFWEDVPYDPEVFVKPEEVIKSIKFIEAKVITKCE